MKKILISLSYRFFIGIVFLLAISKSESKSLSFIESSVEQVQLIELFSSEGCSSCPPADAWFAELRKSPQLWKTFVPVAFHVDYWNRLGWTDQFSKASYTDRQQAYASQLKSSHVYTPAFVKNGEEWRQRNLLALPSVGKKVGVLSAKSEDNQTYEISFKPLDQDKSWHIYGAFLGNELTSKVSSGENSGRTLNHNFITLSLVDQKMEKIGQSFTVKIKFPHQGYTIPPKASVAFWVSIEGSIVPLQAVGSDL